MKKILVVSWFVCAMALIAISCSSKEESVQVAENNSLNGTTWYACHHKIDTINDTITIFSFDAVVRFLDDTTGVILENNRIFSNNEPLLADKPVRTPFTYELNGMEGSMVLDFGEEAEKFGMPRKITQTFKMDSTDNSITTFAPNGKRLGTYQEVK